MKFSYSWLKELAKFKQSPKELADLIELHITEIEGVSSGGGNYSGVIVAEILEINAHPNADKLHLVTLDIGLGKRVTVVCGAKNIEVGQKVPLAQVGAVLPGGELKPATIRGVESRGMICSGQELGTEEKSEGILVLPKTASVGRPVNEALNASSDAILDLKILSNRPDYLSYVGMAREIAAVAGIKWSMPLDLEHKETGDASSSHIGVETKDEMLCPHYRAHYISNVEVKESPQWLKDKLINSGIRPISNLVDISNLVMLETGQPVHIFDYAKVNGKKIIVRSAKANEKILTLDGVERELTPNILLIADTKDPIALAGIMGGELSAVTDLTREVVVEVANFNQVTIRRGSKALGVSTDASLRFERGLTVYLAELGMQRTLNLIQQILPEAVIGKGDVLVGKSRSMMPTIECPTKTLNDLLGTKLTNSQIAGLLERLEFRVEASGNKLSVTPPPFRGDIKEMADVAEEVLRLYGIDKVAEAMPEVMLVAPQPNREVILADKLRDRLVIDGFTETPGHCFIGESWANKLGLRLDDELKLSNPLNSGWTHLISNLWPNLLRFAPKFGELVKIFEINSTFNKSGGVLPLEEKSLALFVSGRDVDAYRIMRGVLEQLLVQVKGLKFTAVPGSAEDLYINVSRVMAKEIALGSIEELSPRLAAELDLPSGGVWAEINLSRLNGLLIDQQRFEPFSRFPSSSFDLSVELPNSASAGMLIEDIKSSSPLIREVAVFDVYHMPDGGRSLGLRVIVQSDDRTLTDGEIESLTSKVVNIVATQHRGKIRGSQS
ncbi:MAG: phenylalanine--tRNA ligase subunit beta [Patescibacteria group bacterium]|jgi:phenylalanyl-tRNA synthetase beta chain